MSTRGFHELPRGGVLDAADVRILSFDEAGESLSILAEAANWSQRFGEPVWQIDDRFSRDHLEAAAKGEIVGGFSGGSMTSTMRLQRADPLHWPGDAPGEALYLHKIAVRRSSASQGWTGRLVGFARARAIALGVATLRLDTLEREPLIEVYRRLGFSIAGRSPAAPALILMQMPVRPRS